MPLKGVLFSRQELNIARPQDPERFVMEDALTELLDTLPHYGAQAIQLDAFCPSSPQELSCLLSLHHIPQQEALLVAATDRSLALADGLAIATLGYRNPFLPPQSLRQPEIVVEGFEVSDAILAQDEGEVFCIFAEEAKNDMMTQLEGLGYVVSGETPPNWPPTWACPRTPSPLPLSSGTPTAARALTASSAVPTT